MGEARTLERPQDAPRSTTPDRPTPADGTAEKTAVLYRMVMPQHICPFGLKSRHLLRSRGYAVEDHHLRTRAEQDAFRAEHDVRTTPQTFIDGERIGGYDDLRRHFGLAVKDPDATTYRPVIAIFATTALLALAVTATRAAGFDIVRWAEYFLAFSMVALAIQKLQDVEGFANGFLGYDLLAQRHVPYARAYPYLEAFAGLGMVAAIGSAGTGIGAILMWPAAITGLVIGTIGAVSVFKAVYIEKRELKCACVGGGSNVPLGLVSLTEDLMMMAMGAWMIGRALV